MYACMQTVIVVDTLSYFVFAFTEDTSFHLGDLMRFTQCSIDGIDMMVMENRTLTSPIR